MAKKKKEIEQEKTPVILVVDDNQQNLELLQAYLEDMDCETVPANDGLKALKIIGKNAPDLILLDVMMPILDGFEACERIREFSNVPIIMVTARGTGPTFSRTR